MKHEYLSYDALQLAAEDTFIHWVKEEKGTHASAWESWLREYPEMEEKVSQAKEIVLQNLQAFAPIPHKIDAQDLWARIDHSTVEKPKLEKARVRKLSPLYLTMAIAAAIALLLLFFPFQPSETQLRSPNGEHLAFTLPDSSSIELNAASSIRYVAKTFQKKREVYLDGEAFFQVEKGDSFLVKTDLGNVRVLGTSFNVFEREESFEVQCLTGKVEVSTPDGSNKVILLPGEIAILGEGGRLLKGEEEIPELASWRNYVFKYDRSPLYEILDEIKRQFNIEIDFQGRDIEEEFTGSFEGQNLEKALQDVLWPMNLVYEIKAGLVIISEEK